MVPDHPVTAALTRAASWALLNAPRRLQIAIAGGPPPVVDGQTLDIQTHVALALERRFGPPKLYSLEPPRAREVAASGLSVFDVRTRAMARVRDVAASAEGAEVPVRVYTPQGARPRGPCLVWYHGGGGVIGSITASDRSCRLLAADIGCAVVSVDYRLGPEHPFPAAVDDALAAYLWARERAAELDVDPARIAVGGDSMGGNLAAVVCQLCAARGRPPPAFQLLVYPVVDWRFGTRSYELFGDGYLLTAPLMDWFRDHYLSDPAHVSDVRASPLLAADVSGLPPALVVTAGFDLLRDEGRAYADRLRDAGVRATYRCHDSLIHGFLSTAGLIGAARAAVRELAAAARDAW